MSLFSPAWVVRLQNRLIAPVGFALATSLLGIVLGLAPSSAGAEEGVRVTATDGTATTWTAARIKEVLATEMKPLEHTSHGQKHTSTAVPLLAVLKAAGIPVALKMDPKADPHVKNYNLRLAVVVQAGDGYTATFSLGELLPEVGGRESWLALDEDGKPLTERDGPMKLIVPTDQKPSRWVRNVTSVTVVDPTAATTRPAAHGDH
jgi:hypothetical protein